MEWMMTVGQISKLFNTTAETLRHYDRIGLLKPIINEENGYRYYSIKEMEKLDLILDAKYLEIPLSNIKEIMKNDNVGSYLELIELQEETIDEKIDHLLKLKEQAKEKKIILNEMMSFKNNYDFDSLEIIDEDETIIQIPVEMIVQGKIKQKDSTLKSMYLEPWMTIFRVKDNNTLIDDETYIGMRKKDLNNLLIPKNKKIIEQKIKGKIIRTKFVGTFRELEDYTKSIIKHFYKENEKLDFDIAVSWIWSVYNEIGTQNFMEIRIPLLEK
ncbi:MAG: MerR family transcriptional regulator [Peptostreptococcaceae bacterium]